MRLLMKIMVVVVVQFFFVQYSFGQHSQNKPNIIFIMNDDGGAYEFGCYGNTATKTPNIDKLAENGVLFNTCFSGPVCTPSRVFLFTGKYGFRTGVFNNENRYGGRDDIDLYKEFYTIDQLMKDAGYVSAIAGKGYIPINDLRKSSFDEYCCWGEGLWLDDYDAKVCYHAIHPADSAQKRIDPKSIGFKGEIYADGPSRYWNPFIIQNGKMKETNESDFGPDIYKDFLMDFIVRNKDGDKPFFAYFPMCLPHGVMGTDGKWDLFPVPDNNTPSGKSATPKNTKDLMRTLIEYKDKLVGEMIQELDELELLENTIIFVTADNGSGPKAKGRATERGVRVPMVVYYKGKIKEGYVANDLIDFADILPTLADLAGQPLPKKDVFDGDSFVPVLYGKKGKGDFAFSYIRGERVVRTSEWLLDENHETNFGTLYYCGDKRGGIEEYKNMTEVDNKITRKARRRFVKILKDLPAPTGLPYRTNQFIPGLKPPLWNSKKTDK